MKDCPGLQMSTSEHFSQDQIASGARLFSGHWEFVKGVVSLEGLPEMGPVEVAFAGRSNVGKSSLINALVGRKSLTRTSNTPGRTQEINVFQPANGAFYIVDLPGYGFAKAPKEKVAAWTALVRDYLRGRASLARVFLLIDSRHGLKDIDRDVMEMLDDAAVSYQLVLTKVDKINAYQLSDVINGTEIAITKHAAAFPRIVATSASKGDGISDLRATIAEVVSEHRV